MYRYWNVQAFYSLQIEHYALKIAFCVQCFSVLYFPTAYYSIYGVNSYTCLFRNDYFYLKIEDLVIYLAQQYQTVRNMPLKLCKGGNLVSTVIFSVDGVILYNSILDLSGHVDLKKADLTIEL